MYVLPTPKYRLIEEVGLGKYRCCHMPKCDFQASKEYAQMVTLDVQIHSTATMIAVTHEYRYQEEIHLNVPTSLKKITYF